MKIYVDERGFVHAEMAEGQKIVGDFLSSDIQGSVYAADEYINACLSVENGRVEKWEGTGNAHTVIIEKDGVEIFNEYTEESLRISGIKTFRAYLEEWREYLLGAGAARK
ncbi:YacL family protein [Burkholderia sp. BCC1972]|uniref:YacL family protein n=1 Tax=Burkholderia sp. BCC1972 TaxID=2817438 RepID=UPI002ABE888B|nr:YacL family protein [Burkholderia sp. BCC1972]